MFLGNCFENKMIDNTLTRTGRAGGYTSAAECHQACKLISGCTWFTYTTSQYGGDYLKKNSCYFTKTSKPTFKPFNSKGYISGPLKCPHKQGMQI